MKDRLHLIDYAMLALFAAQLSLAVFVGLHGPASAPLHYGLDGQPDRWGGRGELAGLIAGLGILGLITAGGLALAARREGLSPSRTRGLRAAQGVAVAAIAGCTLLIAFTSLSAPDGGRSSSVTMAGLSLIFVAIGAFVGRVGPNPLVGVRTPWSYKSRLAWDRSNRLAGCSSSSA